MSQYWTKWIILSLSKYFTDGFGEEQCYIHGEKRFKPVSDVYNVRFLGPDLVLFSSEVKISILIDCEILTTQNIKTPWEHFDRVGRAQTLMLKPCIKIYKLGDIDGVDDQSLFASLQLKTDVKTTNYENIDPVSSVSNSSVQAMYSTLIDFGG